jgi:purine nucleosidase
MNYQQKYLKYKKKYIEAQTIQQTGGEPLKIIIDTDPGIDDALAILLALGNPKVNVVALTTVFGNFPDVRILTDNALKILNLVNKKEIPVYEGASKPLTEDNLQKYICETMSAQSIKVHGTDGLADLVDLSLETGELKKESEDAADAIIRLAKEYPCEITLVTLGPLTNLAIALDKCKELPSLLKSVIIMGGALFSPRGNPINTSDANMGNARPSAEANFFKDPLAASKVLNANFDPSKLFLIPLDLTTQTDYVRFGLNTCPGSLPSLKSGVIRDFIAKTHAFYADVYLNMFRRTKVPFHDSCAVFMAISPESFMEPVQISVNVETKGEFTSGMTVIDNRGFAKKNITFFQRIDEANLYAAIIDSINKLQGK